LKVRFISGTINISWFKNSFNLFKTSFRVLHTYSLFIFCLSFHLPSLSSGLRAHTQSYLSPEQLTHAHWHTHTHMNTPIFLSHSQSLFDVGNLEVWEIRLKRGLRPFYYSIKAAFILTYSSKSKDCVTDLDQRIEMIIFESRLTTFESSIIFKAAGAEVKISLSLKPNHHMQF